MKAVHDAIHAAMIGDATIRTLIGGSASDERVYYGWPAQPKFEDVTSGTKAGLVIYSCHQSGAIRSDQNGEPDVLLMVDIFSKSASVNQQVLDRLLSMLDCKALAPTGYSNVYVKYSGATPMYDQEGGLHHLATTWNVRDINRA